MVSVNTVKKSLLTAVSSAAVAGAATVAWGNRETSQFELHEVTVPVLNPGALPAGSQGLRVLHISDLHMIPGQDKKQQWVRDLAQLEPDLVVNTGDNLGDKDAVPLVINALDPLLNRPGVFVFGSNDYFGPRPVNPVGYLLGKKRKVSEEALPWQGMRAAFVERGWEDATHQRVEFRAGGVKIAVAGVDDPHHDLDDYGRIQGRPNPDADIAIGLLHSPDPRVLAQFEADGYDLTLSGHTHGGQLCLPGQRAIVTNCGIDQKRASGLHRFGDMWMHVSNGLGTSKYAPVRLFCRPSATLLTLTERKVLAH
ncbi:metallophosphoesterase [Corynebacterium aquilae]|uniref:Metallophosphoesterase n=1 Tax=Corynebacterium aquilae DSM 44791 TaxID=1431546 RepID=A0A1L7CDE8_9CORY|nr:metallophosphoesterase [Corynebacterium aquilae]APT83865.1 metallophosphoesterase [Corynebacterium aquilae DSM 44791]